MAKGCSQWVLMLFKTLGPQKPGMFYTTPPDQTTAETKNFVHQRQSSHLDRAVARQRAAATCCRELAAGSFCRGATLDGSRGFQSTVRGRTGHVATRHTPASRNPIRGWKSTASLKPSLHDDSEPKPAPDSGRTKPHCAHWPDGKETPAPPPHSFPSDAASLAKTRKRRIHCK